MADVIVSVVAEEIVTLLKEQATYHLNLIRGAEEEVRSLADELETVRNVLDDAERRRYKDINVRAWLSKLERTSHEMEEVLDEWKYDIRKLQIAAAKEKVRPSFIPTSSCLCCNKVAFRHKITKKIIDVKRKLEEVLEQKDRYNFVSSQPTADHSPESWRDPSTSFADLELVRGRESDRDALVRKLMGRRAELGIQVMSIVGVGGLGKTTLAQLIYNDSRVEMFFDLRIWISVSNHFDLVAIAKDILDRVGRGSSSNTTQLDVLLKDLKESISGKMFLLVLDDVWTEDSKKWEPFKTSLSGGREGSKILVTTRNEMAAKAMGKIENDIYRPRQLSDEDCWILMHRISLSGRSEEECQNFQDIGNKIASKCKGLPLAACVLGSLLQFKNSLEEWESVFESEIWQLEEVEKQLFPHLLMSYNELSPALKRCFSYCAVFPKDFEIVVEKLIENWIAQGYLGSDIGNIEDMELKGQEYFENLAMRSLFQDFKRRDFDEKIISCKMHDIVHDFAQSLRKNRSSVREEAGMKMTTCLKCSSSLVSNVKTYRSLVLPYDHPYICDCLTSLRVLSIPYHSLRGIPQEMEDLIHLRWLDLSGNSLSKEDVEIICQLYNLQFLQLKNCKLEEVSSEIGNLIQLRHLNLSNNISLEELPEEIGNLIQLRYLDLSNNISLEELPEEIGNLIQLRYLDLSSNNSLKELPEEIGKLIQLRHLDLSNNYSLKKLPDKFGNLIRLTHLYLSYNDFLWELPKSIYGLINLKHIINTNISKNLFSEGLSELRGLRTLSEFSVERGGGKLGWLKNSNLLSGSLKLNIKLIDDLKDIAEDVREADLKNKIHLRTLTIWFNDELDVENDEVDEGNDVIDEDNDLVRMDVMDALEPHPKLRNLYINEYKGSRLSGWITSPLFQLRSIQLRWLNCMQSLPAFGKLPCLEEIEISNMKGLKIVGREFLGTSTNTAIGFPNLKKLKFDGCRKWEEWEDITVEEEDSASVTFMPNLMELLIRNCGSLKALPERLLRKKAVSLEYVEIKGDSLAELVIRYQDREGVIPLPFAGLKVPFGLKRWKKPDAGWVKINVDGSWLSSMHEGGVGGVARDHEGKWLWGFAGRVQHSSVDGVEVAGALVGLQQAWLRRIRRVFIETDSRNVCLWLRGEAKPPPHLEGLVNECITMIRNPWELHISNTSREENYCADELARRGRLGPTELQLFEEPPDYLADQLHGDSC